MVNISNIISASSIQGRISIPVNRSEYLYARFKHVSGVPALDENNGMSLSKLKILDNLIERLSKLKEQKLEKPDTASLSPKALDAVIEGLKQEIHRKTAATRTPFGGFFSAEPALVNLSV